MRKTLRKELLREIRSSSNRFLSIFVMVALGVMFLVGLRSAAPDMRNTSDHYFDASQLYDLQILSTLGLTEGDIAAFSRTEGVEAAEGGWSVDAMLSLGEVQKVVKAMSLSENFDIPVVLEGRLPERAAECAIDRKLQTAMEIGIGDTVTLEPGEGMEDALTGKTFTVTGIVDSPLYISLDRGTSTLGDGSVSAFLLLPRESFALDYYTLCNIRADGARELDAYGTEYDRLIRHLTDRLEAVARDRADLRYETLMSEAQTEIEQAQTELDDARAQANAEIADGEAELEDARRELDDGWAELTQAKQDYADGEAQGRQELSEARQELDDGWAELSDARDSLNSAQRALDSQSTDAQSQLAAAEQELAESEALLAEQEAELAAAQTQTETLRLQTEVYKQALDAQNQQVADAEQNGETIDPSTLIYNQETYEAMVAALAEAERQVAQGQAALSAAREQLDAGRTELEQQKYTAERQIAAVQAEINAGWDDYYSGKAELEQGEANYAQGQTDLETELADAAREIADGQQELTDGEAEYADGLSKLEAARDDAEKELNDGQAEIDAAREAVLDMEPADVYVLDRDSNYGFVSYDQNATRMENLAQMLPVIFFVVAALVCLTTMTRMVEEERTQIGAIKAMGYGTGTIAWKFLLYGMLAAVGGTVVGAVIGTTLIPWVIFTSYGIMYTIPDLQLSLYWGLCLGAGAAGLVCTVGATLWAMMATARSTPAQLMRPKTPKAGKRVFLERITPLWRRMSFSMKVSARNLLRYQKRFWMTVIGVAGCTALMIAGLGLRSSIFSIIDIQFDEIYQYDAQVSLDTDTAETRQEIETHLGSLENVESIAPVYTRSVSFSGPAGSMDGYLMVTDEPAALYEQIDLREMKTKTHQDIPGDGVVIDQKLSELLGVQVGDSITVDCGKVISVKVGGIVEHYVYHYAYMDAGYYTELTGEDYRPNEFLVSTVDASEEAISSVCENLMEQEGVRAATNMGASARSFRNTMDAMDAAVAIIVLSAAALALVVLYNLTNINITERLRELATIKVLGFYDGEVAMYIYRENIVLTVLGIALGQVLGKFLCTYLIRTIEMDIVMFGREALLGDYLLSVVLSVIFAVIVNFLMYFRMKKIDMVQSLKSVE